MKELRQYIEREMRGPDSYFGVERSADELELLLNTQTDVCRDVADELGAGAKNIYLVGAGGSLANLRPLKQIFDSLLRLPVEVYSGHELVGSAPFGLGSGSLVVLASNSGEVEDTLGALRFARQRGARTVAVVAKPDSTLAREADAVLPFHDWDEPVMVPPLLVGLRLAETVGDVALASELRTGLEAVPAALRRVVPAELARAEERAREFLGCVQLFVLGAGVLAGLAYKLAYNIVMENMRIGAAFIDASEFRHGPCEALERTRPDMLVLVGSDWSRSQTLRTLEACRRGGARTLVYDAADFGEVHPWLTPLVAYPAVEPFIVYSAVLRGIVDLAPRVQMGGGGFYAFEKATP
jgi:fructoselysine-6-P-deglycase FrlB-like protein